MNALSLDIRDMLVADTDLELVFAKNLFVGREPEHPDNCVTLFDTGGGAPSLTYSKQEYNWDTIQVRVRNNSYLDGMKQMYSIKKALHGIVNVQQNDMFYTLIRMYMPPFALGWDANDRVMIVASFEAQRR